MRRWIYVSSAVIYLLVQIVGYGRTWQINLVSSWWAYSRSQKAYCTVCPCSPAKTAENFARYTFLCIDHEALTDYMAISLEIKIYPVVSLLPASDRERMANVDLGDLLIVSVFLGENGAERPAHLKGEAYLDPVPEKVLSEKCVREASVSTWWGKWELTEWSPSSRFLLIPQPNPYQAWAWIAPDEFEFTWSVQVYVEAYENWRTGLGFSHSGSVTFVCKRVD